MTQLPTILSLCDLSGVMVAPWLEAGFPCVVVDLRHPNGAHDDGRLTRVGADVATYLPPLVRYGMAFAFPPCTDLAQSGARWFKQKGLGALAEAISVVESCRRILEWTGAPWMLENPVGQLSTYWRKPDHYFDPYEYGGYLELGGDAYTKRTCLWTGGGFVMPSKRPVPGDRPQVGTLRPGRQQVHLRAFDGPTGFAQAVFVAHHDAVLRSAA